MNKEDKEMIDRYLQCGGNRKRKREMAKAILRLLRTLLEAKFE